MMSLRVSPSNQRQLTMMHEDRRYFVSLRADRESVLGNNARYALKAYVPDESLIFSSGSKL